MFSFNHRKLRVAFLTPCFSPDMGSESLVNSKLVLALLDAGAEVEVFTRRSQSFYASQWEEPWLRLEPHTHLTDDYLPSKAAQIWSAGRCLFRSGVFLAGARWAWNCAETVMRYHRQQPFDVILSRSYPDSGHLAGLLFHQRFPAIPWIVNFNDPPSDCWPDQTCSGLTRFFTGRLMKKIARKASCATFPTLQLSEHIQQRHPLPARIREIPHIGLLPAFMPELGTPPPAEFILTHAGYMPLPRNPQLLLRAFAQVQKRHPEIPMKLRIVGKVAPEIRDMIQEIRLEDAVEVAGSVSFLKSIRLLSESSALLLLEGNYPRGIFMPSKITDYFQAQRPILAISPDNGVLRNLSDRSGFYVAAVKSQQDIEAKLETLLQDWTSGRLSNIKVDFPESSPENIMQQYEMIFHEIGLY